MKHASLFCSILLGVLYSSSGFSSDGLSQLQKLKPAFDTMRSLHVLPILHSHGTPISPSSEIIPADVAAKFEGIQKFVFGRADLLSLKACDGCKAHANADTMAIDIEVKYINDLRSDFGPDFDKIITIILAHEVSHFSYEYITLSSATGLSPNGHISLLTKGFLDYVDMTQFIKMSPSEQQLEVAKYFRQSSLSHSEVDLLGLITLQAMNIDVIVEAKKFLDFEVSRRTPEELAQTDFELRLKTVNEAFPAMAGATP
jgi:hypothetical protein